MAKKFTQPKTLLQRSKAAQRRLEKEANYTPTAARTITSILFGIAEDAVEMRRIRLRVFHEIVEKEAKACRLNRCGVWKLDRYANKQA